MYILRSPWQVCFGSINPLKNNLGKNNLKILKESSWLEVLIIISPANVMKYEILWWKTITQDTGRTDIYNITYSCLEFFEKMFCGLSDTFKNNPGKKNEIPKHLKKTCWLSADLRTVINFFPKYAQFYVQPWKVTSIQITAYTGELG